MKEITKEDGHRLLEASAQRNLGISAEEFTKGWKSGELRGRRAERVAMLLPSRHLP